MTSAVRCIGNTLLLQPRTYSPPLVITAIGNPAIMRAALDRQPGVQLLQQYVQRYQLGFAVRILDDVTLPGYDGLMRRPWRSTGSADRRPAAAAGGGYVPDLGGSGWCRRRLLAGMCPSRAVRVPQGSLGGGDVPNLGGYECCRGRL